MQKKNGNGLFNTIEFYFPCLIKDVVMLLTVSRLLPCLPLIGFPLLVWKPLTYLLPQKSFALLFHFPYDYAGAIYTRCNIVLLEIMSLLRSISVYPVNEAVE
ncbi:hypothetical protein, unlikely [Trypanosoma brucei brucei TREU927]|uniref:Uncharacterized protein n=1 Tax=Trypanosoma brucei brucei (strain 927/4 GUTat10.1) TaxID=185431 RepID=Q4GY58_TRYB2|nr:hypothetical protein, unlikely [Trypanosoma brucei brucei TREU927]CAJ16729.1 hypothetical protein, unlikely [Trypanosoma brucei brucei TREU927]